MGKVSLLQLRLDLQQVRFVARRETDGVLVRGGGEAGGGLTRGVDELGADDPKREVAADDAEVPKRLSALAKRAACLSRNTPR